MTITQHSSFDSVAAELEDFLHRTAASNHSVLGYHYPFYLQMLTHIEVGQPLFWIARNESGSIVGYLPGMLKQSDWGQVWSSLPFFGPNAGVISNRDPQVVEALFAALRSWMAETQPVSVSVYSPFDDEAAETHYDALFADAVKVEKFTNFIPMDALELSTSLQYDLRKAERSGVIVEETSDVRCADEVYAIYIRNCMDYGIPPKPKTCIEHLIAQSATNSGTRTYLARHDGRIIGALIMIYSPATASYYLPCSIHEFRSLQPTSLLIHYAMMESKARGIRYWNWEASPSKESGVYKFKKKWGSVDGRYAIYVMPGRSKEQFAAWGKEGIAEKYPFFFVYPFYLLDK